MVEGYELALKKALELLPGLVCGELKDLQSEAELKRAIRPSVMSKQYGNEDFITDLVVKACSEWRTEGGAVVCVCGGGERGRYALGLTGATPHEMTLSSR